MDGWSDFISLEPLPARLSDGRLLRAMTGTHSDGLSGPKFCKCDLQSTNSFFPTFFHDALYRGYIEESLDDGVTWTAWTPDQYTKPYADNALKELCYDNFVPAQECQMIYNAVAQFGQSAWDSDTKERMTVKMAG